MADATTTVFDKALKVYYTPQRIKLRAYEKNPLLALMPKKTDFQGRNVPLFIWPRTGQGVAATFSIAQSNKGTGLYKSFDLTHVKGYGLGSIQNDLLHMAKTDKGAFLEATAEIDGVMHQVTRDLAIAMYRDRTGVRGQLGNTAYNTSTNVVTLLYRDDITNFEVGMYVSFADASDLDSGTVTLRQNGTTSDGDGFQITQIDRQAGTFVIDADPTSIATDDYVIRHGDVVNAGSSTLKLAGVNSWVPTTVASSGDSHFGVDRYSDRDRFAGIYVDGSSMSVTDALIELGMRMYEAGAEPDMVFMGPMQFAKLIREIGSTVAYDVVSSPDEGKIGFKTVVLHLPCGTVKVVLDINCPANQAYMLTMKSWVLWTSGPAPKMLTYGREGLQWLRESDDDAVEFRVGWYGQIGCYYPGANGRVKLAA